MGRNRTWDGDVQEIAMKITEKGQVTIPIGIRQRMGLLPHTEVDFLVSSGNVILRKSQRQRRRGAAVVEALRGKAPKGGMSTDEIMALTRGR
jgi:AbrB family looped-hinge helix DNA binding protein